MKRMLINVGFFLLLGTAPGTFAQVQVGDTTMHMNGTLTGGYSGSSGDQIQSSHGFTLGADAQLSGDYYNPNFLNFTVTPYYNRSTTDSSFQSLTSASGVDADVNLFTGSKYPGYVSYHYARNTTGNFGLLGTPSFTAIGNGQGFGIGWSILEPNWPTFSVSYSQGNGSGNIFGTNEESTASTKTLNLRSSYHVAGWNLNTYYTHLGIHSDIPFFLSGDSGNDINDASGNSIGINGSHALPLHGSIALSYDHSNYTNSFESTLESVRNNSDYTTNTEAAILQFHPTPKLTIFANQNYTDNLNGYFYENIINGGGGVPIFPTESNSNSSTLTSGVNYLIFPNLFAQAQITYYKQAYFGNSYDGSYVSGTLGYNRRILQTFTVSATVIESSNKFADSALGFVLNLNAFRHFGAWETSGAFSYAQNVQTVLVTYTTSYYNYNGNVHRRLGRGKQWTGAFNGSHSGLSNFLGTSSHSEGFTTSLALRRLTFSANYVQSQGQSLLTSTGIQPIPPTPGLPPEGLIVYNGTSYGASVGWTPIPRLTITGSYSNAKSDTISNSILSNNRTEIYFGQFQYRLRRVSVLGGFTKFSQGISAAGTPPGSTYSYFIGVSRWLSFF